MYARGAGRDDAGERDRRGGRHRRTIELALHGTLDGLPLDLLTHDRIVLREGRILERRAQMDVRPLLLAALRRPRTGIPLLAAPLARQLRGGDDSAGRPARLTRRVRFSRRPR